MTECPHRKLGLWLSGPKKLMRGQEKGRAREMSMMDVERKEELKKINQISITCTRACMSPCASLHMRRETWKQFQVRRTRCTIDARRIAHRRACALCIAGFVSTFPMLNYLIRLLTPFLRFDSN
jgi:hypothetical protein